MSKHTTHDSNRTASGSRERLLSDFKPVPKDKWREAVEEQLHGVPFEKKMVSRTPEGIDIQPVYRREDLENIPHLTGLPGFAPYGRGCEPLGHLGKPWEIAQEIIEPTAEEFNKFLRHDLMRGLTVVHLILDRAGRLGKDPDQADAEDVGRGGVSIATATDLGTALEEVDLTATPIFIQAGAAALPVAAMLAALTAERGNDPSLLRGAIDFDPLAVFVTEDTSFSLDETYDSLNRLTHWACARAPQLKTIAVHGDVYREAGADAVQELAFAVAAGAEHLRRLLDRGLDIAAVARHMRFTFSLGSDFFMEIAKLRAARLLWANVMEAFGGDEESRRMTIHVRTSRFNKSALDPYVNMLRVTTESLSGIFGGCDSLNAGCFDEPVRQADEFSRRIARNTQLILQKESHFDRVVDPAGGSWYLESLTQELAGESWKLFQNIESRGGMAAALQEGFPQELILETVSKRSERTAKRKDILVGTNKYANPGEKPLDKRQPDYTKLQHKRKKDLTAYRSQKASARTAALEKLTQTAETEPDKVFEAMIEAASAGATLGEMMRIRKTKPVKSEVRKLRAWRQAEPFENLRKTSEDYTARTGSPPRVFLANIGSLREYKPRADFSTGFFQTGGFKILDKGGFDSPQSAAEAAARSGVEVSVICSTDARYPEIVEPFINHLKNLKCTAVVVLAGYPKEQVEAHQAAGVKHFIYLGADVLKILSHVMQDAGVTP